MPRSFFSSVGDPTGGGAIPRWLRARVRSACTLSAWAAAHQDKLSLS
jgi:hypothetical protein